MTDCEQAYRDLRAGVEALADRMLCPWDRGAVDRLLASSAPATASEGATEAQCTNGTACLGGWGPGCCNWPATGVTSSDGDRGLSEIVEADGWGDVPVDDLIERAIEAIAWGLLDATSDTADRWPSKEAHDDARATAKRILAARTAQPEGVERVEWAGIYDFRPHADRAGAEAVVARHGGTIYRRTVTEFAPVIGEWEVVGDDVTHSVSESELNPGAIQTFRATFVVPRGWQARALANAVLVSHWMDKRDRRVQTKALREAADAIQELHPGEVKNSVLWLRARAAWIERRNR